MNSDEHLANTWKFCPDEPVIFAGYPITCPGCGRADGIRFWVHPDKLTVSVEHTCVPFKLNSRQKSKIRRWDEPRVTREFVRQHGIDLLSEFNAQFLPLLNEIRSRRDKA